MVYKDTSKQKNVPEQLMGGRGNHMKNTEYWEPKSYKQWSIKHKGNTHYSLGVCGPRPSAGIRTLSCDVQEAGPLWCLGHKEPPRTGLHCYKGTPECSLALAATEGRSKETVSEPGLRPSPETKSAITSILDLQPASVPRVRCPCIPTISNKKWALTTCARADSELSFYPPYKK